MLPLAKSFYKAMPNHCEVKAIKKEFKIALDNHLKKYKWTIEYQEPSAIIGNFHNIVGYNSIKRTVSSKFKTLLSAYKYSQTLEYSSFVIIKRDGKEGGTTVLPGGFVIWTEESYNVFVDRVDIKSPLFGINKPKHPNSEDYVLKLLKAWWKITPKVFKLYYPKLNFKETMKKEFGELYF